jgi:hypothetical protein
MQNTLRTFLQLLKRHWLIVVGFTMFLFAIEVAISSFFGELIPRTISRMIDRNFGIRMLSITSYFTWPLVLAAGIAQLGRAHQWRWYWYLALACISVLIVVLIFLFTLPLLLVIGTD